MSSPFLPDDDENNPFAAPVDRAHIVWEDPIAPAEEEEEINDETPIETNQANVEETDVKQHTNPLDNKNLRRLVPERFATKSQISIKLAAIEKNKSGNPIIRFDVEVHGLPRFRQQTYKDVRRTFNEITRFNQYLTISNLEVFVPVFPLCNTSYPTGGDDENKQLTYIWQEWFNRITGNPILIRDEEFVFFVENDFGYSVINANKKTSVASGFMRKTLKQFAVPSDDFVELAEFRPLIKGWYLELTKLHKQLDRHSKSQKQVSIQTYDLSQKLGVLSLSETAHLGMKNLWEKLSKITQLQSDLLLVESVNEMGTLGDGFQALLDDFYQVKEALTNRHLIMRELDQAETQTKAKTAIVERLRLKSALDPMGTDGAIRSLEYATKTQESLELQIKRILGEMMCERAEVLQYTENKVQMLLKRYTLNKIEHHRKILKHLENIRLDVRIVDEKGGLSRLNRDNLLNLKHNLTQSQQATGDAWSLRTVRQAVDESPKKVESGPIDARNAASLLGVATF